MSNDSVRRIAFSVAVKGLVGSLDGDAGLESSPSLEELGAVSGSRGPYRRPNDVIRSVLAGESSSSRFTRRLGFASIVSSSGSMVSMMMDVKRKECFQHLWRHDDHLCIMSSSDQQINGPGLDGEPALKLNRG